MLISLLVDGDADEIAYAKEKYGDDWEDNISPLFVGGHIGWVNSLTTLASVLNGTTFISACNEEDAVLEDIIVGLANALGISQLNNIYDFQLEQFGITTVPGETSDAYLDSVLQSDFIAGTDQAWYDLSISGCNELNKRFAQSFEDDPSIYYFSYAGNKTYKNIFTGNYLPKVTMWTPFWYFSIKMGRYTNRNEFVLNSDGTTVKADGYTYSAIDSSWKANDGMVNTISARYPLNQAHKSYDASDIESGIWQVMPDQNMDHLDFCGGLLDSKPITIRLFYLKLMKNIDATYSA